MIKHFINLHKCINNLIMVQIWLSNMALLKILRTFLKSFVMLFLEYKDDMEMFKISLNVPCSQDLEIFASNRNFLNGFAKNRNYQIRSERDGENRKDY
ncbi:MAG: hypothetical protein PHR06_07630 [Candidatus Cloacimonetes bacterium]|nr:hypothetical protein [Candidatus Cloacimonadota bacterium]